MSHDQLVDFNRGAVMLKIAETLCMLADELTTPWENADQNVIDAWHYLVENQVNAAEEALRLTDWEAGRPFVRAVVTHVRSKYKALGDDASAGDWWRGLAAPCYHLKWAAWQRWPEIIYPEDSDEESA